MRLQTIKNNTFFSVVYWYFGSSHMFRSDYASDSVETVVYFVLRCLFQVLGKNGIVNRVDGDGDVFVEFHGSDK